MPELKQTEVYFYEYLITIKPDDCALRRELIKHCSGERNEYATEEAPQRPI